MAADAAEKDVAPAERGALGPFARLGLQGFLLLATAVFLLPLAWMILTGLKPLEQTLKSPPEYLPRTETATLKPYAPGGAAAEDASPQRMAVVRQRELDAPHAIVHEARELAEAGERGKAFEDRLLVPLADLRPAGGAWGEPVEPGPAELRYQVGAEPGKRLFACTVLETCPAGWVLVKESVPDAGLTTKPAGSGEPVPYAWGVVPPEDLRSEVRFMWGNVPAGLRKMDFGRMLFNTLWIALLGMIGTTFASALAAYGFAFGSFRGRAALFAFTLATMMIPFPATMVPLYQVYRELGWIGTFKPLWVHSWFGAAFNIFLLRQFFLGLPRDLLDAARIDGCSELEIFFHVVVPLSKPALAMVALFHFLYAWKDFMGPLLYLTDKSQFTISLGLQAFLSQQGGSPWHLVMAAATIFSLPLVVLFVLAMKTFIRGVAMTGIKG
ncbi:MAG: carbohydrate ABC transporter permease [Planctomycetota bacterium]|nr:carbohydrate ABC transporter permease [Planctomycetota bacterium]